VREADTACGQSVRRVGSRLTLGSVTSVTLVGSSPQISVPLRVVCLICLVCEEFPAYRGGMHTSPTEEPLRHFAQIIKLSASKVYRQRVEGRVYALTFADVHAAALVIASQRCDFWSDQVAGARKDLTLHIHQWLDREMRALGWKRIRTREGRRRWMPTHVELPYGGDPDALGRLTKLAYPQPDDDEYRLSPEWEPMNRQQRLEYGSILLTQYPRLTAEFMTLDAETKPVKTGWEKWRDAQELKRDRLRVKWGRELNEARYILKYGDLPNVA
jgi:hypothetical protein